MLINVASFFASASLREIPYFSDGNRFTNKLPLSWDFTLNHSHPSFCSTFSLLHPSPLFLPLFLSLPPSPPVPLGKYWRSVHRYSLRLGLSLLEAKRGDSEEAEAVSAMASLSVANTNTNTNTMDHRYGSDIWKAEGFKSYLSFLASVVSTGVSAVPLNCAKVQAEMSILRCCTCFTNESSPKSRKVTSLSACKAQLDIVYISSCLLSLPPGQRRNRWKKRNHCNGGRHEGVAL